MDDKIVAGKPYPLGATWENDGVNFAIFSENASKVVLCLYANTTEAQPMAEIELPSKTSYIHHGFIPGLLPGQLYGYRIHGPYAPAEGHRFNPNKLLLDPYTKAIAGKLTWNDAIFGYDRQLKDDASFSDSDSAPYTPRSVVVDTQFNWEADKLLSRPYDDTIIYELHVKGFSKKLPGIPEEIRGTYAALAHPVALAHFRRLGINAIELLPVQYFISNIELEEKGLTNYWGYDTIGFLAPHPAYFSSHSLQEQMAEFKNMVITLHNNDIEVIMDVVYNHTGEGNEFGPTLCLRGVDNYNYYRLDADNRQRYTDFTGTGNTIDTRQPCNLQLIMDSLRYWVTEMHIDGFRFDLASTLGRDTPDVNWLSSFFAIIYQDPVLSRVKLIAEPWDVGDKGYQVGRFPTGWAEWNGRYRDTIRDYWRGKAPDLKMFLLRLFGSPDLYQNNSRTPAASINFITAHDGFTLHDLVTYEQKHNEANGNNNEDGSDENRSKNWGVEGETDDAAINRLRKLHQKNMLTTLLFSQGVPMIRSGDEIGKTQSGNNNVYCQDNEIGWINWDEADEELLQFTCELVNIRKQFPIFSQYEWTFIKDNLQCNAADIELYTAAGDVILFKNTEGVSAATIGLLLREEHKEGTSESNPEGKSGVLYLIFNGSEKEEKFLLPDTKPGGEWGAILDTNAEDTNGGKSFAGKSFITIAPYSIVLMR